MTPNRALALPLIVVGVFGTANQLSAVEDGPVRFSNSRQIKLPILVLPESVSNIQEIQLYVSTNAGKKWTKVAVMQSTCKWISYSVPQDGTYWFTLVTVHKNGKSFPPDIASMRPMSEVVVSRPD